VSTLLGWIEALLVWWSGRSAGQAAAQSQETQETADADTRIAQAENAAPADRAAVVRELRGGQF
jgi:hypothetical protein